jgi:hypothetical protein
VLYHVTFDADGKFSSSDGKLPALEAIRRALRYSSWVEESERDVAASCIPKWAVGNGPAAELSLLECMYAIRSTIRDLFLAEPRIIMNRMDA